MTNPGDIVEKSNLVSYWFENIDKPGLSLNKTVSWITFTYGESVTYTNDGTNLEKGIKSVSQL